MRNFQHFKYFYETDEEALSRNLQLVKERLQDIEKAASVKDLAAIRHELFYLKDYLNRFETALEKVSLKNQ